VAIVWCVLGEVGTGGGALRPGRMRVLEPDLLMYLDVLCLRCKVKKDHDAFSTNSSSLRCSTPLRLVLSGSAQL